MLALRLLELATQRKTLSPKQMFERLPIALAQVKLGNTFENLLNEVTQIIQSPNEQNKLLRKYIII